MAEKKTILVVEDDPIAREGLNVILRRDGYEVVLAGNGEEALAALHRQRPDLILLDMLMPVLDGWHFLQRVQEKALPAHTPVVVATSSTVISREWAQAHGCAGFLRQPVEPDELLREVRRCLAR